VTPFLLALALAAAVPPADPSEPEPITLFGNYGPVIDRAEAAQIGLFRYRQSFGALRFVRAGSGRFEARIATRVGGVMLEQAVPLDSMMLSRVEQGLVMLRDRSATNVELLLSPRYPLDASSLGPATDARARAGGICLGLLGLGTGMVVGTALTCNYGNEGYGWPEWRKRNLGITAGIAVATAALGAFGGVTLGGRADAGRPVAPKPRCAIAGFDDYGYPIYEEEVKECLAGNNTTFLTGGSIAVGTIAALVAGSMVSSGWSHMSGWTDPNGVGQLSVPVLDVSIIAAAGFLGNTVGRNLDRAVALEKLRNRPRPEPTRPLHAMPPPAIEE
jgi:hypothetical protein